jgi:cytochrome c oxidase cbb3-type subunit IV
MDINFLRSFVTVLSMAIFVGIVWWAWSQRNAEHFDQAAKLPFSEEK